jgi:hypothetical protein
MNKEDVRRRQLLSSSLLMVSALALAEWATPARGDTRPLLRSVTATAELVTVELSAPVSFHQARLAGDSRSKLSGRCYLDEESLSFRIISSCI